MIVITRRMQLLLIYLTLLTSSSAGAQSVLDVDDPPEIVSRSSWKAKPANAALMKPQTPNEIIIHHTSVAQQPKTSLEAKMIGLQGFSQTTGKVAGNAKPTWGDVPYHYYIDFSGRVAEGRDVAYAGDTNTKYNTLDRIQIVLEGNFEKEQPSPGQLRSLYRLLAWLSSKHNIPTSKITPHNAHAATDCPGVNLKRHLPKLIQQVEGKK